GEDGDLPGRDLSADPREVESAGRRDPRLTDRGESEPDHLLAPSPPHRGEGGVGLAAAGDLRRLNLPVGVLFGGGRIGEAAVIQLDADDAHYRHRQGQRDTEYCLVA